MTVPALRALCKRGAAAGTSEVPKLFLTILLPLPLLVPPPCPPFLTDGLRLLVDVLGPPPATLLKYEMEHWRHLVDPAFAAAQQRREQVEAEARAKQEQKGREQQRSAGGAAGDAARGNPGGSAGGARAGGSPQRCTRRAAHHPTHAFAFSCHPGLGSTLL